MNEVLTIFVMFNALGSTSDMSGITCESSPDCTWHVLDKGIDLGPVPDDGVFFVVSPSPDKPAGEVCFCLPSGDCGCEPIDPDGNA